jgi:hypothetical protein
MAIMEQLSTDGAGRDNMQWLAEQPLPSPNLDFYDPLILSTQDLGSNLNHATADIEWQQPLGFPNTHSSSSSRLPLITQTGPPFRAAHSQILIRPGYHTDSQVQTGIGQGTHGPPNRFGAGFGEAHSANFSQFMVIQGPI